ncbi:MAG: U32 family peptidase [Halieaceae bacterium]|jgi:O2-independent ubiquinone biosynthesis protein UbiU|nr:U32 family peptidase [Halieaceae bacterium]
MELVCPAGSPAMLRAAVDAGADAVYIGLKDETNARHFSGLNFNDRQAQKSLRYAHDNKVKVFMAINTYAQPESIQHWYDAVDLSADLGVDAIIAADIGIMDYAASKHPATNLHLSVQGSATSIQALEFYANEFGIKRAVLPRVLSLPQVKQLAAGSPVDLEVFGFGSLCIMAEGRCFLSSYVTGESPNTFGACSPGSAVRWEETPTGRNSYLNGVLIDSFGENEKAGYPTLCKGRFRANGNQFHVLEEPTSLNTLQIIPELEAAGIVAIKIEGRQRSPAYATRVVKVWREALDDFQQSKSSFTVKREWMEALGSVSEGAQTTLGAYSKPWQ